MAKKRGRKSKRQYFTEDTELAIIEYLASEDQVLRNKIYNERIHHSFYKLAENLIHTFKFYYTEVEDLEDLKHEVICFLLEKLHYFKVGKGKAFSYFSIVGKNYLILYNNKNYAKKKKKADLLEVDTDNEILNGFERKEVHDVKVEFLDMYITHVDANLTKYFKKETEIKVADAVLTVLKNREHLEIFNKKAIYIYIREITGLETPIITKVVKKLKNIFNTTYSRYLEGPSYL
jgi:DNA-directed RNA polymerase subunit F